MTDLEYFEACTHGPWNNTKGMVTWKIENGIMYFQCSREDEDWDKNISIMPTMIKIQGVTFWVPVGLAEAWEEIKEIVKTNPCVLYVGYSLGAELASLSSAYTGIKALAFACPNFYIGGKKAKALFFHVKYVHYCLDFFTYLPLGYKKGRDVHILKGKVVYPEGVSFLEKLSGHSPKLYRQLLGVV